MLRNIESIPVTHGKHTIERQFRVTIFTCDNSVDAYVALEFADHSTLQQMMWQFTQLAQVVVHTTGKARIWAEMKRLRRYHPVCSFVISRRSANRPWPAISFVVLNIE